MCFSVSFFHQKKSTGSFCPARSSSHPFSSLFSRALPNTRGTLRACKRRARPPNAITRHERPSRAREYRWQLVFFVALLLPRFTHKRVSRLVRDILRRAQLFFSRGDALSSASDTVRARVARRAAMHEHVCNGCWREVVEGDIYITRCGHQFCKAATTSAPATARAPLPRV